MRWLSMSVLAAVAACSSSQDEGNPIGGDAGTNASAVGGSGGVGGQSGSATTDGGLSAAGQGGASGAGSGGAPNTGGGGAGVMAKGTPGVWEPMLKWPADTKPIS